MLLMELLFGGGGDGGGIGLGREKDFQTTLSGYSINTGTLDVSRAFFFFFFLRRLSVS